MAKSRKAGLFFASASFACFALGFAGYLWSRTGKYDPPAAGAQQVSEKIPDAALALTAIAIPPGEARWTAAMIKKAMANCDAEARKNPDGLYFLVTPVEPATLEAAAPIVPPIGENHGSFFLVQTPAILRGLEDGSLDLSPRRYGFSVLEVKKANTTKGNRANGPSKFSIENAAEISKFKIGFDFEDENRIWTSEYDRQKGVCYWVNLRFIRQLNSPSPGRMDFSATKSFPSLAATLRCANHACDVFGSEPSAIK